MKLIVQEPEIIMETEGIFEIHIQFISKLALKHISTPESTTDPDVGDYHAEEPAGLTSSDKVASKR